ncbi:RAD52 motif-containing protein 1 isoform X1 [Arapaima gigas]
MGRYHIRTKTGPKRTRDSASKQQGAPLPRLYASRPRLPQSKKNVTKSAPRSRVGVMDIDAEVIEFRVPTENNKTLFVWDIPARFSEANIYESLWSFFSGFGAIYWLKVCPNAAVAPPGFYAVVKMFSAAHALRAQRAAGGQVLTYVHLIWRPSVLQVRLCAKQYPAGFHSVRPLSAAKCQQLANYYLGFNGWSSKIITLKNISGGENPGEARAGAIVKYGCVVELSFPQRGAGCRGVGVAEEAFESNPSAEELCGRRGQLQKRARDSALVEAFQKVLLVVLSTGKVVVECRVDPEDTPPDEDLGLIEVNDLSWDRFEREEGEDDEFSDLNLDFSHFS